ncbi:hypothetical protein PRZ48_004459 [Zasmidium cellare]|uniref:Heterokaryon incompatibility domain-containing protein n=1 Tax=Zasmidium cellare TaxID=395010 RepID=A0ABR0EPP1_ZASCE|nr:hypothetical protein PRZ48_004459 [Zasmidium cellare]
MESKQCVYCANLTIDELVRLAEKGFYGHFFPDENYYQHHQSFRDLESSAHEGCDLCWLILDAFKTTPEHPSLSAIGATKEEVDREGSLYTAAMRTEPSQVRLAIAASHVYSSDTLEKVEVFDILLVQVGYHRQPRDESDLENQDELRTISLLIRTSRAGQYIALSHCWGGAISALLTAKTVDSFQEKLPMDQMPRNFEDAITITRRLGVQYLWIDSLCIIQDSKEDWALESKKMGQVYRDSVLTIYAAAARDSTSGILYNPSGNESQAALKVCADAVPEVVVSGKWDPQYESMKTLEMYGPLNHRGWTLQELVLSPRQLHYGTGMIYWRCQEQTYSLDGLSLGCLIPEEGVYGEASSILFLDEAHSQQGIHDRAKVALSAFNSLVESFSGRKLTYDTDKLPALSGLCERIHRYIGGDYLAGIWSSDLAGGLLWHGESTTCKHLETYRAPSWSWATTNNDVLFDEGYQKRRHRILSETTGSIDLELISHKIEPLDSVNPYGEVRSGYLIVKGLTIPLIRGCESVSRADRANDFVVESGTVLFDEPETWDERFVTGLLFVQIGEERTHCIMSLPMTMEKRPPFELNNVSWSEDEYAALLVWTGSDDEGARGLVLRLKESSTQVTFERIGIFRIEPGVLPGLINEWKTETLILV